MCTLPNGEITGSRGMLAWTDGARYEGQFNNHMSNHDGRVNTGQFCCPSLHFIKLCVNGCFQFSRVSKVSNYSPTPSDSVGLNSLSLALKCLRYHLLRISCSADHRLSPSQTY
jgi:hypothetical protein